MEDIIFIGDELSASAYRLAGVGTITVPVDETARVLDEEVPSETRLVLLGAPHAERLGREALSRRMRQGRPPLMVVGDAAESAGLPDFVTLLRERLGVAT